MRKNQNNQYYLKDKKIQLITKIIDKDYVELGYKYIVDGYVWAYAKQLSQDQIYEARTHGEAENRLFVLNYRTDLKLYDFIAYKDKYYTITRIDTTDDYNTDMYIYTIDTPMGDTREDIQPADYVIPTDD